MKVQNIIMKKTNPNGANQYTLDPRQRLCWDLYVNPKSETFANAYQSAMSAGYEEGYAAQITTAEWFLERLRRLQMLSKAEKVLSDTLEIEHMVQAIGAFGPILDKKTKKPIFRPDSSLLKIKQDSAKFVAERLGKNEGYSTRTEITGENGESLKIVFDTAFSKKDDTAR